MSNQKGSNEYASHVFKGFEDALQYFTALEAKADAIITRNGGDFKASALPVMTAGEFLATINK